MFSNCTFEHHGYHRHYHRNVSDAALFPDESHMQRGGRSATEKRNLVASAQAPGSRAVFISQREGVFTLHPQKCLFPRL